MSFTFFFIIYFSDSLHHRTVGVSTWLRGASLPAELNHNRKLWHLYGEKEPMQRLWKDTWWTSSLDRANEGECAIEEIGVSEETEECLYWET